MQFMAIGQRTLALYAICAIFVSGMLGWFCSHKVGWHHKLGAP